MALSFNQQKGKAQKSAHDTFEFKDGDNNNFRIVGDILPRYQYWVPGSNGKNFPVECLSFNRTEERFDNLEKDWVSDYFPDLKCSWGYACQVIDLRDGKLKLMNLKKKMWEQICSMAPDLGDPTDPDKGWDVHVKREKTGPLAYNITYTVLQLRCKNRPLTEDEKAVIADLKSMDEVIPRQTPEQIKRQLDAQSTGGDEESAEDVANEFDIE